MILLIGAAAALAFAGCAGGPDVPAGGTSSAQDSFLSRPRFDKPKVMPLSRTSLSWTAVEGASGYEVQMGPDEGFATVLKSWTVKGTDLEVASQSDADRWYRVRAFADNVQSLWSPAIVLEAEAAG